MAWLKTSASSWLIRDPIEALRATQFRNNRLTGANRIDAMAPMLAVLR